MNSDLRIRLHVRSVSPFLYRLKMGSMLMLFALHIKKMKDAARTKTVTLTARVKEPQGMFTLDVFVCVCINVTIKV